MNNQVLKISLNGLHKRFGEKIVLDDVNLDVMPGESMVIIGGSGSGKSVTLKCILGLLTPNSGSIKIDGQEMVGIAADDRKKVLNKFGMLFQGAALFDSLPVWENVAFGLLAQRLTQARCTLIASLMLIGITLFSGSLYLLSITQLTWLGMITPFGGLSFISAWLLLGWSMRRALQP